jgi:hypothetical protein
VPGPEKLWTTLVVLGIAWSPVPRSKREGETPHDPAACHPHHHGDGVTAVHQQRTAVIHNPQPLLPLLTTFHSSSLNGDWGHGRKDKLR